MDIYKIFTFEAARSLPNLSDDHPCKNIHGHSFKIIITASGDIQKNTGFVMDFEDLNQAFHPIHQLLDHSYLNDIEGLENPSSEILCVWIWERLSKTIPTLKQIEIKETDLTGCIYKGD